MDQFKKIFYQASIVVLMISFSVANINFVNSSDEIMSDVKKRKRDDITKPEKTSSDEDNSSKAGSSKGTEPRKKKIKIQKTTTINDSDYDSSSENVSDFESDYNSSSEKEDSQDKDYEDSPLSQSFTQEYKYPSITESGASKQEKKKRATERKEFREKTLGKLDEYPSLEAAFRKARSNLTKGKLTNLLTEIANLANQKHGVHNTGPQYGTIKHKFCEEILEELKTQAGGVFDNISTEDGNEGADGENNYMDVVWRDNINNEIYIFDYKFGDAKLEKKQESKYKNAMQKFANENKWDNNTKVSITEIKPTNRPEY